MTSASDVARLVGGQRELVRLAVADLRRFWNSVDVTDPLFLDGLQTVFVGLADRYGEVGAAAAAEWYETVRGGSGFNALVSEGRDVGTNVRAVKYATRDGVSGESLKFVEGMLQAAVLQAARNTIADNAGRDPKRPRFARVPVGKTCAWCILLGSRGFVYWSADSAGEFTKYHNDCDCAIVPSWDANPKIAGYDPKALHGDYLEAREATGWKKPMMGDILAEMRSGLGVS